VYVVSITYQFILDYTIFGFRYFG